MAIEDQFIIRADEVDLGERDFLVARHAPQHLQPRALLAVTPGRRGKVQDDFRALGDEFPDRVAPVDPVRPEILVVPDVLADGDAKPVAVERERRDVFGRLEIAVLVKHIVGRQQTFRGAPDDFAMLQHGGGIFQPAAGLLRIAVHVADAERHRADARGGFGERGEIGVNEIGALEQVARRVAAEEQLGREDEFRAAGAGLVVAGQELQPVGGEIADGRIELEQADDHFRFEVFDSRDAREPETPA